MAWSYRPHWKRDDLGFRTLRRVVPSPPWLELVKVGDIMALSNMLQTTPEVACQPNPDVAYFTWMLDGDSKSFRLTAGHFLMHLAICQLGPRLTAHLLNLLVAAELFAACVVVEDALLPLHLLLRFHPDVPHDILLLLLEANPKGAHHVVQGNWLPLHLLCRFSPNVTLRTLCRLLDTYLEAASQPNDAGWLPFHLLCRYCATLQAEMVSCLLLAYPGAAACPVKDGWLPLHLLCCSPRGTTPGVLKRIVEAFPEAAQVAVGGWLPLHLLCNRSPSAECVGYLLEAYPQGASMTTTEGFTPLQLYGRGPSLPSDPVVRLLSSHRGIATLGDPPSVECRPCPESTMTSLELPDGISIDEIEDRERVRRLIQESSWRIEEEDGEEDSARQFLELSQLEVEDEEDRGVSKIRERGLFKMGVVKSKLATSASWNPFCCSCASQERMPDAVNSDATGKFRL